MSMVNFLESHIDNYLRCAIHFFLKMSGAHLISFSSEIYSTAKEAQMFSTFVSSYR